QNPHEHNLYYNYLGKVFFAPILLQSQSTINADLLTNANANSNTTANLSTQTQNVNQTGQLPTVEQQIESMSYTFIMFLAIVFIVAALIVGTLLLKKRKHDIELDEQYLTDYDKHRDKPEVP